MGRFPNSDIHGKYSDWHWQLNNIDKKYKRLYVADIDRLWLEYDFHRNEIVAVFDIKWEDTENGYTATEKGIYEWFEKMGCPVYIVFISKDFQRFSVYDNKGYKKVMTAIQYADWLLSLRDLFAPVF